MVDFASLLVLAQKGISLIGEGKKALASVKDQIADGKVVLATNEQAELNRLLAEESVETEAAYQDLKDAIAQSRK